MTEGGAEVGEGQTLIKKYSNRDCWGQYTDKIAGDTGDKIAGDSILQLGCDHHHDLGGLGVAQALVIYLAPSPTAGPR